MPSELRTLTEADWAEFKQIRLRSLADSPEAFGAFLADAETHPEAVWRERATGTGPTILCFQDGEAVSVGGAYLPPDSDVTWLWGMWTSPHARGRGHGTRILGALLAWADQRPLEVRLHVTLGNRAARALYAGHGFVPTGERLPLRDGSSTLVETMVRRRAVTTERA